MKEIKYMVKKKFIYLFNLSNCEANAEFVTWFNVI
jgi:hypothetical protein